VRREDDRITYINKGQFYGLTLGKNSFFLYLFILLSCFPFLDFTHFNVFFLLHLFA
jgi:hypothetical protein